MRSGETIGLWPAGLGYFGREWSDGHLSIRPSDPATSWQLLLHTPFAGRRLALGAQLFARPTGPRAPPWWQNI
jgi:hypothetical protein